MDRTRGELFVSTVTNHGVEVREKHGGAAVAIFIRGNRTLDTTAMNAAHSVRLWNEADSEVINLAQLLYERTQVDHEYTKNELARVVKERDLMADQLKAQRQVWQPIETAPRNGEQILLAHLDESGCVERAEEGAWEEVTEYVDGVVSYPSVFDWCTSYGLEDITHWMPLPAKPV